MRTRLAAVAAALALAACSGAVNPKDLDPYADANEACRALMDAIFSQGARCGITPPLAETLFDAAAGRCVGLERPTVAIDLAEFRGCVERLADAPCWEDMEDVCPDLDLAGTVQAGGACTSDSDCAPELEGCHPAANACGGSCRAFAGVGQACGAAGDPECERGAYCDGTRCQALRADGLFCSDPSHCGDGLRCAVDVCRPVLGMVCSSQWDCETRDRGYYCPVWETTASPGCRSLAGVPSADVDRCGGGKECRGDQWCDEAMTCRPRTLDGDCAKDEHCLRPASCQANTCALPVKLGGACRVGLRQCELGAFCAGPDVGSDGRCMSWPTPASGLACGGLNGELVGCLDGWCKPSDSIPGTFSCSPYTPPGQSCQDSGECGPAGDLGGTDCVDGFCAKSCPL